MVLDGDEVKDRGRMVTLEVMVTVKCVDKDGDDSELDMW